MYGGNDRLVRLEHCADDDQECASEYGPEETESDHLLLGLLVHVVALEHVCIGRVISHIVH